MIEQISETFSEKYFDLRYQEDDEKDSVVSLTFKYQLSGYPAGNYTLNALILHEEDIELYTSSGNYLLRLKEKKILKINYKMTTYLQYNVNLSNGQKANLAKTIRSGSEITLRLKNHQLHGNDELMLN